MISGIEQVCLGILGLFVVFIVHIVLVNGCGVCRNYLERAGICRLSGKHTDRYKKCTQFDKVI